MGLRGTEAGGTGPLGVSNARLKCLDIIRVALRGGERAVENLSVVSDAILFCLKVFRRQGTGSDDLWKFLPTTELCDSPKTDRGGRKPGTLAWIPPLINLPTAGRHLSAHRLIFPGSLQEQKAPATSPCSPGWE